MTKLLFSVLFLMSPLSALGEAVVGKAAPAFTIQDAQNKPHSLEDFKGKWVVLEWYNKDCPYVKKHYESGNMQSLQKKYTEKGAVWLTVNSGAKGKQGYLDAAGTLADAKEQKSVATAQLIDDKGVAGKAYGAKTTPHMFVINPEGNVVYAGAIDDNDSADSKVIAKSVNYVSQALDQGMAGKKVAKTSAKPYGCSVKY